jgi:peptidyl-prolyl cis-trans isomerase D
MLQLLRAQVGTWVIKILLALIIISFGIWGIGDIFRNRGADVTIARVEGEALGPEQLRQMVDNEMRRFQQMYQGQAVMVDTPEIRRVMAQNAVQQWTNEKLYVAEAAKLGLSVSEAILRDKIANDPAFRDAKTKQFSPEIFRNLLQNNNLTEAQYISLIRRDMINAQLAWALGNTIPVPKSLQQLQARYEREKRDAVTADIAYAQYPKFAKLLGVEKIGQPSDAELQDFMALHKAEFSTPEFRAVDLLWLSPDKVASSIAITDAELQVAYDADPAAFAVPERRSFSQAVFSTKDEAEKAYALIQTQKISLAKAAQQTAKLDLVPLDHVTAADLPQALQPLFTLAAGSISQPIQSDLGWHVAEVKKITPGQTRSFATVKNELRQKLAQERASAELFKLSDQLQDGLAAGQSFAELAKTLPVEVKSLGLIARDGTNREGKKIALPIEKSRDNFLTVAFNTEAGKTGGLTEAVEGGFFTLQVQEAIPAELKSFAAVREQVRTKWENEDRQNTGQKIAEKLAQAIDGGQNLVALAKEYGFATRTLNNIARDGAVGGAIGKDVMTAPKGKLVHLINDRGITLAVATKIHPAPANINLDGQIGIANTLRQEFAADISTQLNQALQQRFDVTINHQALENLY